MSEIEKLYENAGIEAREYCDRDSDLCFTGCPLYPIHDNCKKYFTKLPLFTAEKQIKLIEFFISSIWWENLKNLYRIIDDSLKFEEKLAKMVNYLWLSLTEEEKKQIKDILDETGKA